VTYTEIRLSVLGSGRYGLNTKEAPISSAFKDSGIAWPPGSSLSVLFHLAYSTPTTKTLNIRVYKGTDVKR